MPRRARGGEVRELRDRLSRTPLGRLRAEADHGRSGVAGAGAAAVPAGAAAAPRDLMPLAGRHVVLGVSGGVACYKSFTLAPRLAEDGAPVDVVRTAAAPAFVRPLTFEALVGRPALAPFGVTGS